MKSRDAAQEATRPGAATEAIALEEHAEGCVLAIHVQPGSRRAGIVGRHGDALKVAVTAAPEKGKANEALLEVLHKQLGVKRSTLEILSGHTSRRKKVLVRTVDAAALRELLRAELAGTAR
jgi:uncharacterized protein (TIGR00251 family)